VYFLLSSYVFAALHFRPSSSPLGLYALGHLCVRSTFHSSTSFTSFNSFNLTFLADPHPLTPIESHSYENHGGEGGVLVFPNERSPHTLTPLFATLTNSGSCKSFTCHSYENTRGVWGFFPFWNSAAILKSALARSHALFARSFHSFRKECLRTLLQPTRSTLFLKTAGCVATEGLIRSSLFIRLVLFCLQAAAGASITTKPLCFCHIQWRTAQG
jgi:hypothetical protein